MLTQFTPLHAWPRPPAAIPHARLDEPPGGARVTVAGLVLVRQRPGTAKGVTFLTLEDETGVANVVIWREVFRRFRRAVVAGRLLRVTGRLQRDSEVVHVVAEVIEDISPLLDTLAAPGTRPVFRHDGARADGGLESAGPPAPGGFRATPYRAADGTGQSHPWKHPSGGAASDPA